MDWTIQTLRNTRLENDVVQLRRLTLDDKAGYERIAYNAETWAYFVATITDEASLNTFMEQAIHDSLSGSRMVFSIIDAKSGAIAGSTAFGNMAAADRRLEIGWSWLGEAYRGTGLNKATKALLLEFAFTQLGCERVEFKTDVLNTRARRGLVGIGGTEDGVMRSFNVMPGGRRRDAVYYSILKAEWPAIRAEKFAGLLPQSTAGSRND